MNSSNRFGIESIARERQAEIEKHLRQSAELGKMPSHRPHLHLEVRWAAAGATAISLLGTIVFLVIGHVR